VIRACLKSLQYDKSRFFLCLENGEDWLSIATLIDDIDLPLEDRVTLCKTPARMHEDRQRKAVVDIAQQFSEVYLGRKEHVLLPAVLSNLSLNVRADKPYRGGVPRSKGRIAELEEACRVLDVCVCVVLVAPRVALVCSNCQCYHAFVLFWSLPELPLFVPIVNAINFCQIV
jgi:hypothetical protein